MDIFPEASVVPPTDVPFTTTFTPGSGSPASNTVIVTFACTFELVTSSLMSEVNLVSMAPLETMLNSIKPMISAAFRRLKNSLLVFLMNKRLG